MAILRIVTVTLAVLTSTLAAPSPDVQSVAAAAKYCDAATTICYSEYTSPAKVVYRIAIPDTATATAPFDVLLSIVAPTAVGWAGIAWGGQMAYNPLSIGWPNAATTVVSSRRATGHTMPAAYPGASYTLLPGSSTNATHWTLNVLCSGCSQWTDQAGKAASLNPASAAVPLAYGSSARAVTTPANNASAFAAHDTKGKWSHDLSSAKVANFSSLVAAYIASGKPALL